jgi:hypothetical protein
LSIFFSCSPTGQISVSNVNDSGFRQSGSLLYSLPQTVIDVTVAAEVNEIIPGPYRQYAEKYLGIKEVPVRTEYYWTIKSVQVRHHTEMDPDYVYAVSGSYQPDMFPDFSNLARDSMILDLSKVPYDYVFYNSLPVTSEEPYFTDLSVKRNFEAEKDIEVSLVMPDSNYLTRPSSKNRLKEKTLEQKAEEAANFIIKLKKRRFKMVSGQPDAMPNGEAMAYSLTELSRLEENYLSLFIGKRSSYQHQRTYHYTPVSGKKSDRIVLFRFLESEGFLDARETRGKPVMLDIANNNKTKGLEQTESPFNTTPNSVLYRVPDQVSIKLIWGESVLSDGLFPVFQSGALVRMKLLPVDHKK